jgi:hypothetical protein
MSQLEAPIRREVKCDRCPQGILRWERVTDFRYGNVRGMQMGNEYAFRCVCGARLLVLDAQRRKVTLIRGVFAILMGLGIGAFGVHLAVFLLHDGMGGNDPRAVFVLLGVLALFPAGGIAVVFRLRRLARDRRRYERATLATP